VTENLWAAEQGALLRGLAHALSNRVGTVVAVAGMLAPGGEAPAALVGMLREEGDRLEALLRLVRLLAESAPDDEPPEPIHLPDLVREVVELHAHHPELRDVPVTVTPDPEAPPVRAPLVALRRTLLLALSAAKRDADAARVAWTTDGAQVVLTVDGASSQRVSLARV
jgi:signal transduction histidine kinase